MWNDVKKILPGCHRMIQIWNDLDDFDTPKGNWIGHYAPATNTFWGTITPAGTPKHEKLTRVTHWAEMLGDPFPKEANNL